MRLILFLLFPIFLSAQINRAYGVIEIGSFPTSSATGPKFAYKVADSSFYRWVSGSTWVKIIPDEPDTLYLKQLSGTTALVDGDTIDISTYFLKSDTTSAFASYLKRPVGWGLSLLTGKYPFVDSSKIASRYYAGTNPTTIGTRQIAHSNGSNLIGNVNFLFTTTSNLLLGTTTDVPTSILTARSTTKSSSPFPLHTLAESDAIAGIQGNFDYETTQNGLRWHNGTRKAYALESTFARGTATRVPFFDANGQVTEDAGVTYTSSTGLNLQATTSFVGQLSIAGISVNSTGINTITSALGITTTLNATVANTKRYGIYVNPTFTGTGGEYAGIVVAPKSQYVGDGNAAIVINTSSSNGLYVKGTANRALIELQPTNSTTRAISVLNASDNNYSAFLIGRTSPTIGVGTGFRMSVAQAGISDAQSNVEIGAVLAVTGTDFRDDMVFRTTHSSGGLSVNERARITSYGLFGVGTASPTEMIHSADDIRVGDSLRIGTLPNQTSATKILSADASGWVGYRAFSDFASTWLKPELEASRDVTILGGSSTDFNIQNTRVQFENTFKVGSDSSFIHNPNADTTFAKGVLASTYMRSNSTALTSYAPGIISLQATYGANQGSYFNLTNKSSNGWGGGYYINSFPSATLGTKIETGWQVGRANARERYEIAHYYLDTKTGFLQNYLEVMQDTAYVPGGSIGFIRLGGKTGNTSKFLWFSSTGFAGADTVHFKFKNTNGAGLHTSRFFTVENLDTSLFVIRKNGNIQFNKYGTPATTAAALSKTLTNYGVGFATDGTVTSRLVTTYGLYAGSGILANHTTRALIPSTGNLLFSQTYNSTDSAYIQIINNLDGNREVRGGLTDTMSTGFSKFRFYQDEAGEAMGYEFATDDIYGTTLIQSETGTIGITASEYIEMRGAEIRLNNGEVIMNQYGLGNIDAATVGAYPSAYIPAFTSTGRVMEFRLARDTFIEDVTLFSVGTMIYECQELTIVSSMTATASTHQEIRFPDASDALRGKKIIVYSKKKDAGSFVPQIKVVGGVSRLYFTTNPAVGGTDPSDQSTLSIDDSTWSDHGTTFEFTCLRIDNTPSYRWVLKQR